MSEFTPEHLELVAETQRLIDKWRPRLSWLAGWTVRAMPISEVDEDWTMRIASASYVKVAHVEVTCEAGRPDPWLGDEATLELYVLHELAHLLFEPVRWVAHYWATDGKELLVPAEMALQDAEETSAWHLARTLLRLDRKPDVKLP